MPNIDRNNSGNITDIQKFNNRQIYTKGFEFATLASTTNEYPIVLNGNARQLYGITLFFEVNFINEIDTISLSINEENVISNVIWWNFYPSGNLGNIMKKSAYFPIHRSLSGSDSIQLIVKSANAHKLFPIFWMSNSTEQGMD